MGSNTTEPQQVTLCSYCTDLAINNPSTQPEHWQTLALLRPSSNKCTICKFLLGGFDHIVKTAMDRFDDITEATAEHCSLSLSLNSDQSMETGIRCKFITARIDIHDKSTYFWRFHIAARESQAPSLTPAAWKTFPTSLDTKVSKIRDLLRVCESSHSHCSALRPCFPPARLIDLGTNNHSGWKLVPTSTMGSEKVDYTTLSYCWGESASLKTTKSTLTSYQNEIPQSELPKTFSDAALITRAVGVRYLWIDALCIIQDDQDDWATESSKMADIYHGSKLSVTANEQTSASGGVFIQDSCTPLETATSARTFLKSAHLCNGRFADIHLVREKRHASALDKRGWTLQENILSPRRVGVASSELKWRCGVGTVWETGLGYLQDDTAHWHLPVLKSDFPGKQSSIWSRWMENYSTRRLTFPEDRLVAMLGLITHYQRITQDEPVLGLWRSSLQEDLAWTRITTRSDRFPTELSHHHNLPSWSPFTCDQAISFEPWYGDESNTKLRDICVDFVEHQVLWEGTPYLSNIKSSFLVVVGLLREMHLSQVIEIPERNPPSFNLDEEDLDIIDDPRPWRCKVQWDLEGYKPPHRWPCLLVQRRSIEGDGKFESVFLVLENVIGQTYRRIGIGFLGSRRWPSGQPEQEWEFSSAERSKITLV